MSINTGITQRLQSHDLPRWLCTAWLSDSKLIFDMGGGCLETILKLNWRTTIHAQFDVFLPKQMLLGVTGLLVMSHHQPYVMEAWQHAT